MSGTGLRRVAALVVAGTLGVGWIAMSAHASSSVDEAVALRVDLRVKIEELHDRRHDARQAIHQRIRFNRARIANAPGAGGVGDERRYQRFRERQLHLIDLLRKQERMIIRQTAARVDALRSRREGLAQWLDTYGVFETCPVQGPIAIADNFGIIREMPGTPRHVHMGDDVSAPTGAAIVAPFDGTAVASSSDLGGSQVKVYGADGYVYNAHLSAYGRLGEVTAGTIVGYVGETGNATAPHDHFEWHPGNGGAVDPYVYLTAACG
jgi:murein DD-endopeptidase MepM/ murein hydrolase activator NlpD